MRKLFLASFLISVIFVQARRTDWDSVSAHSEPVVMKKLGDYVLSTPSWIEGSIYVSYSEMENGQLVRYIMNAATGKREKLIRDIPSFLRQYKSLTGDSTFSDKQIRYLMVKFDTNTADRFTFTSKGSVKLFDRKKGKLMLLKDSKEPERRNIFNSYMRSTSTVDSTFTMLGDRFNLYVRNNMTGQILQLTTDGKEYASYCYRAAKDTLTEKNVAGTWYGHRFIYLMQDDSEVGDLYVINALAKPRPKLETKKMPLPNERGIRRFKLFWYNADTGEAKMLPIDRFKDQNVSLDYTRNGREIYFTRRSRSFDTLELCRISIETGQVYTLITEIAKPHLNVNEFNYRLINSDKQIVWWSDRDGRGNYYLYNSDGKLLNRITQGANIVAGSIVHIDSITQRMIFAGYGEEQGIDPNYRFYYSVGLNGKDQYLLTPGNGMHDLSLSSDRRYAVDTYSRMDLPPIYRVIDMSRPKRSFEIRRANEQLLIKAGWIKPRLVRVKAADEQTELTGVMYLPSHFDENRKYPIISNVYPGPQTDQVPRSFAIDDNGNQSLAELGFIVINVQPRGSSPVRDKSFYTYGYGNLRDYAVADDKYTIETLAQCYSFIDLNRVGIYGHSGGGAETVTAMLTYPDFYKVGVAVSGNHDNNIYIQWWGETYHGLSTIPTNMELAGNLKGKLLLMSGDVDDNVPYASTLRMADALIKKNKRFDFFIFPGMDHSVYGAYYDNLIRYYFRDHLLNSITRNIDIVNHQ